MAFSQIPTLGAGTALSFQDPDSQSGEFLVIENALDIGAVGAQGEQVEVTPVIKKTREYISGLKAPPDRTVTFNHSPGIANYQRYLALVDEGRNILHRVDYLSGDRAEFDVVMLGRQMQSPQGNSQLIMEIFGKQSGDPAWTETPDTGP